MKRITKLFLLPVFILFLSSQGIVAQSSNESTVKSVLTNLLEYSKSKSYNKAAELIAYDGEDSKRVDKDSYNAANKDELNQVKRFCKKISALLELSSSHEFSDFKTSKDGGKEEFILHVTFISGDQKLITAFSFIKTDKGFLLTNMN